MKYDFSERVALIIGAGRGIGQSIAELLSESGAKVAIVDRGEYIHEVEAAIRDQGREVAAFLTDISQKAQVDKMVKVCAIDRQKVNRIIEYIRSCGDFPYDTDGVSESLDEILLGYGIYDLLSHDEYYLLMDELLELAEKAEIAEAVRWANDQLKCGTVSMPIVVEHSGFMNSVPFRFRSCQCCGHVPCEGLS